MSQAGRAERAAAADALCLDAYTAAGGPDAGVSLVAVGGYGRAELAPHSDLDVVLVSDEGVEVRALAQQLWYPLWDSGSKLDHSVRTFPEMVAAADGDVRVALGLLDLRHLAGDPNLTLRLRATMLADWRRGARDRLPAVLELVRSRHRLVGELAHASLPDLKEGEGGLRDATVLKAVVASWLVDVPHTELESTRRGLLDVRDELHGLAGRATDRVAPELWEGLAERLDLADATAAQRHVRELGRRMTHLGRLTWRRVEDVLDRPRAPRARRPSLVPLEPGVALSGREVVLDRGAAPAEDPVLLLRAAALAAERDVVLAPPTAARLARESPPLPEPWPAEARRLLVRLLASGRGLLPVWETLEETGALTRLLPEWSRISLLPHASAIHRFTVDRHVVETCIEASALIRTVARPDVLLVAALLHDIGKGGTVSHSVEGEPIARAIATRIGFEPDAVELVAALVRWHLLLSETATSRDPDDPDTLTVVAEHVRDTETLSLLTALTEADARAASPQAWSTWRASLILGLARRLHHLLDTGTVPERHDDHLAVPEEVRAGRAAFSAEPHEGGLRVTAIAPDRVGLLADLAGAFALLKVPVRGARAWAQGDIGVSVWEVDREEVSLPLLRQRYEGLVEGSADLAARLRPTGPPALPPRVVVRRDASSTATVVEVRAADSPGLVHRVCATLAGLGLGVRSAHVETLGPQAVDGFYVQTAQGGPLPDEVAERAVEALLAALGGGAAPDAG